MSPQINPESREYAPANRVSVGEPTLRFTDVYEALLKDTSLVGSELVELHKLILRKLDRLSC